MLHRDVIGQCSQTRWTICGTGLHNLERPGLGPQNVLPEFTHCDPDVHHETYQNQHNDQHRLHQSQDHRPAPLMTT